MKKLKIMLMIVSVLPAAWAAAIHAAPPALTTSSFIMLLKQRSKTKTNPSSLLNA